MPVIEVRGLEELVSKLRELASGKYMDGVVEFGFAKLLKRTPCVLYESGAADASN